MVYFDKCKPQWHKFDRYHNGFTIKITIYPGLIVPLILEQLRKGLKYRNAIIFNEPHWTGTDWEEGEGKEYWEDIPF